VRRRTGADAKVARFQQGHPPDWPGGKPDGTGGDPRVANQRLRGESEERLYLLDAWRESPLYSARERAALAWTEALTLVSETHAPDEAYQAVQAQYPRGASGAYAFDRHHQRLEPRPNRLPRRSSRQEARGGLMTAASGHDAAAVFDPLRPKLTR